MRIVYAVPAYKPAWRFGGPVHSVSAMAEHLVKRGHEVFVFSTNSNLDMDLDVPTDRFVDVQGVQVRYFRRSQPLKRLFPRIAYISKAVGFLYCKDMRAELDRIVPTADLVHTQLPFCYPTYAAAHAAFRHSLPLFYHQRGVLKEDHLQYRPLKKRTYLRLVELPIMRRAAGLIALTDIELQSYRALGLTGACYVIPNGIDLPPYGADEAVDLNGLSMEPDELVILYLGRVHPFKGVNQLLDAFQLIADRIPRARLVIAGPDESGIGDAFRAKDTLRQGAARVVFTGMVEGQVKKSLLARADLFVLPSRGEGFSMAVLEALAASTAVLLSPGCNFSEVATAGAGRIVDPDPRELATAMSEMLASPKGLRAMGERGRRLVEGGYSWESLVDRMLDVYREGIATVKRRQLLAE